MSNNDIKMVNSISDITLDNLQVGEVIEFFCIIKDVTMKKASNDKHYLIFDFEDKTKLLKGTKSWESEMDDINVKKGDFVKVRAIVGTYGENIQLQISKKEKMVEEDGKKVKKEFVLVRNVIESDNVNIEDYLKSASEEGIVLFSNILKIVDTFEDESLKVLCQRFLEKYKDELLLQPGGNFVHHAYRSGLLEHMNTMLKTANMLMSTYPGLDSDLLQTGVITHDAGKVIELMTNQNGVFEDYSIEGNLTDHIYEGGLMIERLIDEINNDDSIDVTIDKKRRNLVKHMILSHHSKEEWGAYKQPAFPEALVLHWVDKFDTQMNIINEEFAGLKDGETSNKMTFLNGRRLYKLDYKENETVEEEVVEETTEETKEDDVKKAS